MVDFPLPCLLVFGEGGGVFSLLISAISIACLSDKFSGAQVDDDWMSVEFKHFVWPMC